MSSAVVDDFLDDADGVLGAAYFPDQIAAAAAAAAWAAQAQAWDGIPTPFGELDPARLSHPGRVDLLVALERQRAWIDAQQQRLLAVMATDPHPGLAPCEALDKHWVREDVACALRLSALTASTRLRPAAPGHRTRAPPARHPHPAAPRVNQPAPRPRPGRGR